MAGVIRLYPFHQKDNKYLLGHEHDPDEHLLKGLFDDLVPQPNQFSLSDTNREGDPFQCFSGIGSEELSQNDLNFENPEVLLPNEEAIHSPNREQSNNCIRERRAPLSTEEVVRVASALFIQTYSLVAGDPTNLGLPFGLSTSSLFGEDIRNVEMATLLLAAAEKVSNEQYNRARSLLRECKMSASKFGNPVQRVIYYFSDALQERIDRNTQNLSAKRKETESMTPFGIIRALRTSHPAQLIANSAFPFAQVMQFTAMQVLLDNVSLAKRIHMIDLSIKYGQQWTFFLQGIATRNSFPIESITISGVGEEEEVVNATGQRLISVAQSLNLPLKFSAVIESDMKELRKTMFRLEEGETVGIYTSLGMNNLLLKPHNLDNLMKVMQQVNPSIATVIDVEANFNSPHFIVRFTEALFFQSAWFDCIDSLLGSDHENRLMFEEKFFAQGIKDTLVNEGSERVLRYVGINIWRAYFRRFGLKEAKLSDWSMYQASLIIKQFVNDNSCTLQKNGKSLLVGWKGTPLNFVSAWKFSQEEEI